MSAQSAVPDMQRNGWWTPDDLFAEIAGRFGPFDVDAAADATNTKCRVFITEEMDALAQPWVGRVWCNPPYDRHPGIERWVKKAYRETAAYGTCELACLLLPADTSTAWFHDVVLPHAEIHWIRGRVTFGAKRYHARTPVFVVLFRKRHVSRRVV